MGENLKKETRKVETKMTIDQQVSYLMQDTEYGDDELKQAMTHELRQRLIDQKGARLDGETLTEANQLFPHTGILQVGKRRFLGVIE